MKSNLYWLQSGGCGGDTMSFLNAHSPNIIEAFDTLDIDVLWHQSFSNSTISEHKQLLTAILDGSQPLTILCVEGAAITGPAGSGLFDRYDGKAKKDLIIELARRAHIVLAVGTCASFGGVTAAGDMEAVGLQFLRKEKGGLLGEDFVSGSGYPVINIPGCPIHPNALIGTISMLLHDQPLEINDHHAPAEYFSMLVHQGCTRNEYHEYQVEETDFGQKGCLFFHMGCHGPLAHGPCNKFLWNNRSCKTRSGVPCFGCTEPGFPEDSPFFETPNIVGLPIHLPDGVDRPHYLAYKGMAAAAAPERLKYRKTKV